jgi:predicted phage tail protein
VVIVVSIIWWNPSGIVAGVGMVIGGVVNLLSPQAKNPSMSSADNNNSFYFDGPQNTSNQGNPVQLIYADEVLVGSQAISSAITIDQLM